MDLLPKISDLARSTYYYWVNAFGRPDKYDRLKTIIQDIFHTHKGRYGYRRITLELQRQGYFHNHEFNGLTQE